MQGGATRLVASQALMLTLLSLPAFSTAIGMALLARPGDAELLRMHPAVLDSSRAGLRVPIAQMLDEVE